MSQEQHAAWWLCVMRAPASVLSGALGTGVAGHAHSMCIKQHACGSVWCGREQCAVGGHVLANGCGTLLRVGACPAVLGTIRVLLFWVP